MNNAAHLHLMLNHFPIVLPIIGVLILLTGILLKADLVKRIAYLLFVTGAVFAFFTSFSVEGAEEIVEEAGRNHHLIHEHEELAERFALISYVLGIFSMIAFYINWKKKPLADITMYLTLLVACGAIYFGKETGTSGGEISHPEIMENAK